MSSPCIAEPVRVPIVQRLLGRNSLFVGIVMVTFVVVAWIGLRHHEMWRDEYHPWLIARNAASLRGLMENLRYEGFSMILWHLILYVASRFTIDPNIIQPIHLFFAAGSVFLVLRFAPFNRFQKLLFCFGYFTLYEFCVISRNYALGIFLLLLFAVFYRQRFQRPIRLAVVLFLLCHSNAYAMMIACVLFAALLLECAIFREARVAAGSHKLVTVTGMFIALAGMVSAYVFMLPPPDMHLLNAPQTHDFGTAVLTLTALCRGYLPLPNYFPYWPHLAWGTNVFADGMAIGTYIGAAVSVVLLVVGILLFWRKPIILFMYAASSIGFMAFQFIYSFGAVRHQGHFYYLLLVGLWLRNEFPDSQTFASRLEQISDKFNARLDGFWNFILITQLLAGVFAFTIDVAEPFSASKETAEYIQKNHYNELPILAYKDTLAESISARLDKALYYPESSRFGSYVSWNSAHHNCESKEVAAASLDLYKRYHSNILLVLNIRVDLPAANGDAPRFKDIEDNIRIVELAQFDRSITDERYYLYLIQPQDSPVLTLETTTTEALPTMPAGFQVTIGH